MIFVLDMNLLIFCGNSAKMIVSDARCYIICFKVISPVVLKKKIFKVFTIYGHGGHLGHVTWTKYI